MRKDFKAEVSISFPSGHDFREAQIEIRDADSHTRLVNVRLSMEEFATALTCLAQRPAIGEVYDNFDKVGKTLEVKTEWLRISQYFLETNFKRYSQSPERDAWLLMTAQAAFNKDGWEVDTDCECFNNSHKRKQDGEAVLFRINCRRYI